MSFASLAFLAFFPLVTAGYFLLPHRARWAWLLAASCGFYMAFVPAYILILALTIGVDYAAGLLIAGARGPARKAWLLASLAANLGVLAVFKYADFALANLDAIAQAIGWHYGLPLLHWLLPIGLSFHVFQSLAYTIEVYRGNQPPERHLGIFALYVMFYPQLVAGPIERPQNLLHQFHEPHPFDGARATEGLLRMGWGYFKKCVIADRVAIYVNAVYADPTQHAGAPLLLAVLLFSVQIYCDFSGYSDIAVGSAQVMGFRLMENFDRPYLSPSIREFWTRWHVSLSTWFRDYVYFPLGGNRVPKPRQSLNLLAVFLLSGLWHGASWNFVIWGALHGCFQVVGLWTTGARQALYAATGLVRAPRVLHALQVACTFALVTFAWIFFRAATLGDAMYVATHMFTGLGQPVGVSLGAIAAASRLPLSELGVAFAGLVVLALVGATGLRGRDLVVRVHAAPRWQRIGLYYAMLASLLCLGVYENTGFIYFQF